MQSRRPFPLRYGPGQNVFTLTVNGDESVCLDMSASEWIEKVRMACCPHYS